MKCESTPRDELLERYLGEREAVCPICSVHVEGVVSPYVCPGCGHRLSLGLKGVRAVRVAKPWLAAFFALGLLTLGPAAGMIGSIVVSGRGDVFSFRLHTIVWAIAAVIGALLSGYGLLKTLGGGSPRALAGDLSEFRGLVIGVLACAGVVGVGRLVVPVLGQIIP